MHWRHPFVPSASVVPAPHSKWQEIPFAFLMDRPSLTVNALVEYAKARLGKFKVPKEIYLVEEFPTNPSGKVLKRSLREQRPEMKPDWAYSE